MSHPGGPRDKEMHAGGGEHVLVGGNACWWGRTWLLRGGIEGEASSGVASLMVGVPRGRASRVGDGSPGRDVGNRMGMES